MKAYAKIMSGNTIEKILVDQDLGIEIVHNDKVFSIALNNHGELVLRSINNVQLILSPQSANSASAARSEADARGREGNHDN